VDRCRPYFIALLGQRYGWSHAKSLTQPNAPLDESGDDMLKKCLDRAAQNFPWIEKYRDRSVTELEIRHAALNDLNSDTAQRALIYLKKPSNSSG
jgi:nephrocystin-3